jgi:hypothetical protein
MVDLRRRCRAPVAHPSRPAALCCRLSGVGVRGGGRWGQVAAAVVVLVVVDVALAAVVAALLGWPLTDALTPTTVLVLLLAAWPRLPRRE